MDGWFVAIQIVGYYLAVGVCAWVVWFLRKRET